MTLPAIPAGPYVSPRDFGADVGRSVTVDGIKTDVLDITDATATNIARLLMTLDIDGNPANGLLLNKDALVQMTQVVSWDTAPEEFAAILAPTLSRLHRSTPKLAAAPQLLSPYLGYFYLADFLNKYQPKIFTTGYRIRDAKVTDEGNKNEWETHSYLYDNHGQLKEYEANTYYSADTSRKRAALEVFSYAEGSWKANSSTAERWDYWSAEGTGAVQSKERLDYIWQQNTLDKTALFSIAAGEVKLEENKYVYTDYHAVSQTKISDFVTPSADGAAFWDTKAGSLWLYDFVREPSGVKTTYVYDDLGRITRKAHLDVDKSEIYSLEYGYSAPGTVIVKASNSANITTKTYIKTLCGLSQLQEGLYKAQSELKCLPMYFFEE
jgi:YD repeat-containing protein